MNTTTPTTPSTEETYEPFSLAKSPNAIYSLEDFRVQLFQLQDEEQGSTPKIHEVLSSLRYAESSVVKESHMYSLKMSKDSSITTKAEPLQLSSQVWMNWGMTANGNVLTARISESHRIGNECSLSDILEDTPDPKYFLSDGAYQHMLHRAKVNKEKNRGFDNPIYQRSTHTMTKLEAVGVLTSMNQESMSSPQMDLFGQPIGDETTSET